MPVDSSNVRVDSMPKLEVAARLDTRPGNRTDAEAGANRMWEQAPYEPLMGYQLDGRILRWARRTKATGSRGPVT
jgi:hypothetical protein